mmetsp:Transcript_20461/g.41866  ORF Transcript_20461/g.41866 Transcript_20461/m.41866 type:complete len:205 (+) Transcript_20461:71-685(+)
MTLVSRSIPRAREQRHRARDHAASIETRDGDHRQPTVFQLAHPPLGPLALELGHAGLHVVRLLRLGVRLDRSSGRHNLRLAGHGHRRPCSQSTHAAQRLEGNLRRLGEVATEVNPRLLHEVADRRRHAHPSVLDLRRTHPLVLSAAIRAHLGDAHGVPGLAARLRTRARQLLERHLQVRPSRRHRRDQRRRLEGLHKGGGEDLH